MSSASLFTTDELERARVIARACSGPIVRGRVVRVTGTVVEFEIPGAQVGDMVRIFAANKEMVAEVVGFRGGLTMALPYGETTGIRVGSPVTVDGSGATVAVGPGLMGRALDAFGQPLDGRPRPATSATVPLVRAAPPPVRRAAIAAPFTTGVRTIDTLLTLGRGQRVGLFAGAGVGKTMLVQQIARQARCDVKVIGLVGERGIEAHDVLSGFDMSDTVLLVSTSDRSPLERVRGALAATAIAEHFRDQGAHVLLIVDSLTRYAMAMREVGLAAGELPATKGYPPGVFAALPRLLERVAPLSSGGSITGLYTVLVEGDDLGDPVADSARSLLDGHVVLDRELAMRGHFPAIDVLASASRVMHKVVTPAHADAARRARELLADRAEAIELRALGIGGADPGSRADAVIRAGQALDVWMRQPDGVSIASATALAELVQIIQPAAEESEVHAA